jgi:thermitase
VLAVAATDDRGELAAWSNRGGWVDLAAPGVDVVSSFVRAVADELDVAPETVTREYGAATWSGTSFAAPWAAAALARLLRGGLDPQEARERIINSFGG